MTRAITDKIQCKAASAVDIPGPNALYSSDTSHIPPIDQL
jgi:hypothetical protein